MALQCSQLAGASHQGRYRAERVALDALMGGGQISSGALEHLRVPGRQLERGGEELNSVAIGFASFAALQGDDRTRAQPGSLGERFLGEAGGKAVVAKQ